MCALTKCATHITVFSLSYAFSLSQSKDTFAMLRTQCEPFYKHQTNTFQSPQIPHVIIHLIVNCLLAMNRTLSAVIRWPEPHEPCFRNGRDCQKLDCDVAVVGVGAGRQPPKEKKLRNAQALWTWLKLLFGSKPRLANCRLRAHPCSNLKRCWRTECFALISGIMIQDVQSRSAFELL